MKQFTEETIVTFRAYLIEEEKATATVEKYVRDIRAFLLWLSDQALDKGMVLAYKKYLSETYAPASVNSMLASLNHFFAFFGHPDLQVKSLRIQRAIFASKEKELSLSDYHRLINTAEKKNKKRLSLAIQTIGALGLRVSELRCITVEAVRRGQAEILGKGKRRVVFLPSELCRMLSAYIKDMKIKKGAVFVTKNGNPWDRSNLWSEMKKLCRAAGVSEKKVFPHNLRHLFARTFYQRQKDIVRLADLLGHSSVNTTRIYTCENGENHRRQIACLGLLQKRTT